MACDTGFIRAQAEQSVPDYDVDAVRADQGIVTLLFAARNGTGTFAIALRASGSRLFTSAMGVGVDPAELARVSKPITTWWERPELQRALAVCGEGVPDADIGDRDAALHGAAEAALAGCDRGAGLAPRRAIEPLIVVTALVLSLAIILWPAIWRPGRSAARAATNRVDLMVVLCAACVAVAIASTIAWHMAPEGDEIVTLGTRHAALSYLLSWNDGGEPFNPPGSAALFALWLRLRGGFFWARALSIAFIPVTAWAAYRAGMAISGRHVGLSFTGLVVLAPAYLRLAAIARVYAMLAFSLCLLLAMIARPRRLGSRGAGMGVAGVLALWVSYLLWPLALAAPWIAPLDRRDRLRLTGALALAAAALAPRVANGIIAAQGKSGLFEIHGLGDALGYALAIAGQAPPLGYSIPGVLFASAAPAIAAFLMGIAILQLWRRDRRRLRDLLLAVTLVVAPVLALLSGGHGIRERHVIGEQVVFAYVVATGLGLLIAGPRVKGRALGWLLAVALAVLSVLGNRAVIRASTDWIPGIDRLCAGADLVMIVPQDAQGVFYAMLTGDSPGGTETLRWPPVCRLGVEPWCRRVGESQIVSVDEVTDAVIARAATFSRSVWVFNRDTAQGGSELLRQRISSRIGRCDQMFATSAWTIFDCSNTSHPK